MNLGGFFEVLVAFFMCHPGVGGLVDTPESGRGRHRVTSMDNERVFGDENVINFVYTRDRHADLPLMARDRPGHYTREPCVPETLVLRKGA